MDEIFPSGLVFYPHIRPVGAYTGSPSLCTVLSTGLLFYNNACLNDYGTHRTRRQHTPPISMKILSIAIPVALSICSLSCGNKSSSLEKRLEGNWKLGSAEFTFRSGAMFRTANSSVYASYQIIDGESLRYLRKSNGPVRLIDCIVTVKFPNSHSMIWYSSQSGNLVEMMRFNRNQ